MKQLLLILTYFLLIQHTGCSQESKQQVKSAVKVGGPCEGCEAIYESPVPFAQLKPVDTLPHFGEPGPKLEISGIVYKADSRTPARDVVLYIYHTDQTGRYPTKGDETGWGRRHGYLRGWVKTGQDGRYTFYTLRPAAYPNRSDPQHIHILVKEPDKNEYYIDDFVFADDPLLQQQAPRPKPKGGSGVLHLKEKNGMFAATRNIILGLNVEDYPVAALDKNIESGLAIGADCPAFDPLHLTGADAGTKACPMCKYGFGQGVMVWVNHTNFEEMAPFAKTMESAIEHRGEKKLRVFLVYMNPDHEKMVKGEAMILQRKIKEWCRQQNLNRVAMVWLPSPFDESCREYTINPEAKNTVFLYKKRKVISKQVNMDYTEETALAILKQL